MVAADAQPALVYSLSSGNCHDARPGRKLLSRVARRWSISALLMARAYEGASVRELAIELGMDPVVPPTKNRKQGWVYDRALYRRRNARASF